MSDPWQKIKDEWPVIFTATTISILSTTIYHASDLNNLVSLTFWKSFASVLISVALALAVVYTAVWITHGTHSKIRRSR